jgi:hypothetical protein
VILDTELGKFAMHIMHSRDSNGHGHSEVTVHPVPCAKNERPCCTPNQLVGVAKCHERDQFCRAVGRKMAFERAVTLLDNETRAALWKAFLLRFPPRKSNGTK